MARPPERAHRSPVRPAGSPSRAPGADPSVPVAELLCRTMRWAAALSHYLDGTLLRRHGVSEHEFAILHAVRTGAGTSMTRLATASGLTRSGLTRAAQRLEARGLVERSGAGTDRRVGRLRLTAAGETLAEEVDDTVGQLLSGVRLPVLPPAPPAPPVQRPEPAPAPVVVRASTGQRRPAAGVDGGDRNARPGATSSR